MQSHLRLTAQSRRTHCATPRRISPHSHLDPWPGTEKYPHLPEPRRANRRPSTEPPEGRKSFMFWWREIMKKHPRRYSFVYQVKFHQMSWKTQNWKPKPKACNILEGSQDRLDRCGKIKQKRNHVSLVMLDRLACESIIWNLSTYLPIYLSTYLPIYLAIYLSTYLSIYLAS